jgi:hypothetical protein
MHRRRFVHFTLLLPDTPEEAAALPGYGVCTDPDVLRSAAAIQLAAEQRIAAERAAAGLEDPAQLR